LRNPMLPDLQLNDLVRLRKPHPAALMNGKWFVLAQILAWNARVAAIV